MKMRVIIEGNTSSFKANVSLEPSEVWLGGKIIKADKDQLSDFKYFTTDKYGDVVANEAAIEKDIEEKVKTAIQSSELNESIRRICDEIHRAVSNEYNEIIERYQVINFEHEYPKIS
ncbi:MAG: hypothetical protein AB7C92_07040 [Synergistaceae bacterium]